MDQYMQQQRRFVIDGIELVNPTANPRDSETWVLPGSGNQYVYDSNNKIIEMKEVLITATTEELLALSRVRKLKYQVKSRTVLRRGTEG